MIHALLDYMGKHVSEDGAWWILGLNGILLIPLIFAFFFYPRAMFTGAAVALVVTVAALVVGRAVRARRHA